jgi:hypothetical protein
MARHGVRPRVRRHRVRQRQPASQPRARLHCPFALPIIHFIPDLLTYSVPLFLKRQGDRTIGLGRLRAGHGPTLLVNPRPDEPGEPRWVRARKPPSWPRSWANFSHLQLYSHRNAWVNLHFLGQPTTFLTEATVIALDCACFFVTPVHCIFPCLRDYLYRCLQRVRVRQQLLEGRRGRR